MLTIVHLALFLAVAAPTEPATPHPRPAAAEAGSKQLLLRTQTEAPGKIDLEAAERVAELIGAPVFAAGGVEVGQIADISFDDQGRPQRLRITTGGDLALGTRTVEIPKGTFMVLRGAVVLDLTPDAVRQLPDAGGYGR
jgi:hypothetical protein